MNPYLGKVVSVVVYRNDVVVVREGHAPPAGDIERGEIVEFSRKSRMRLAFIASNTPVDFRTMITLTYPKEYPSDGKQVKVHLRHFLNWIRKDRGVCEYLWCLEFQRRGAPHIHLMYDFHLGRSNDVRKGFRFRCSSEWYRIVESDDPKHLAAGTRAELLRKRDGAARYAVKYAHKMKQKVVPPGYRNVGRFWGCSAGVKPIPQQELECTEDDVRGVLEGWEYAPDEQRTLYRVLYNQGDRFRRYCHNELDNGAE